MTSENPDKDSPLEETSKAPWPDQVQGFPAESATLSRLRRRRWMPGFPARRAPRFPFLQRWMRSSLRGPSKDQESQYQAQGLLDAQADESARDFLHFETAPPSVARVFEDIEDRISEFQTQQSKRQTTDKAVEDEALEYTRFLFDEDGAYTRVLDGDEEIRRQVFWQEKRKQLDMAQDESIGHPAKTARIASTDLDQVITKPSPDSTSQPKSSDPYDPQTSFALQLRELVKEYSERMGHSDDLQQIQDVASEILYSRPSRIKVLSEATSSGSRVKFLSRLRSFCLFYFMICLLIILVVRCPWPVAIFTFLVPLSVFTEVVLSVPMLLGLLLYYDTIIGFLKNKMVFLTWKCVCQDTRIAAVPKSFAQRLVEIRETTLAVSPTSTPPASAALSSFSIPTSSLGYQNNLQAQSNGGFQPFYQQGPVPTRKNAALTDTVPAAISIPVTCRYVLFMVDKDGLCLRTIESQSLSNEQLFDRMQLEYRTLKGWFRTWFGLWIFSHCDFYKFEAWTRERYCERGRGIPPLSETGYFYMPRPMDNEPPISKHEFYDRFYKRITPEQLRAVHGRFYNDHDAVDRIPQKKGLNDIVANGRPQFWGIIAREKKSGRRMLIYILISSLPGFIFFFLWLFVLDKDSLQDASTLLLISFTLLGILYAAQLL